MFGYNQRIPFQKIGGYSVESYEPENQQEQKPLNQAYFQYPLVNMENIQSNISLNPTTIYPQYIQPNKTLNQITYVSNPSLNISQYNPVNLSYSLQYNGINPSYAINNINNINSIKSNPIAYQNSRKTKYVYPNRTLDTINYGKKLNIPLVNFVSVPEPNLRSKTYKFLAINRQYPIVNKPNLNSNMPLNIKVIRPNSLMNAVNPIYQNNVIRKRHII